MVPHDASELHDVARARAGELHDQVGSALRHSDTDWGRTNTKLDEPGINSANPHWLHPGAVATRVGDPGPDVPFVPRYAVCGTGTRALVRTRPPRPTNSIRNRRSPDGSISRRTSRASA